MSFQIDYEVLPGVYMQAQHNVPHPNALGATQPPHPPPGHIPAARPWVQPQEERLGPVRVVNLTWLCQSTKIRIIKLKICNIEDI